MLSGVIQQCELSVSCPVCFYSVFLRDCLRGLKKRKKKKTKKGKCYSCVEERRQWRQNKGFSPNHKINVLTTGIEQLLISLIQHSKHRSVCPLLTQGLWTESALDLEKWTELTQQSLITAIFCLPGKYSPSAEHSGVFAERVLKSKHTITHAAV